MEANAERPATRKVSRRKKAMQGLVALAAAIVIALTSLVTFAIGVTASSQPAKQEAPTEAPQETTAEEEAPAEEEQVDTAAAERDAFVSTWAERIDTFNAGTPLEGYGATFAEAAYDNNVDPRFAPAIARVESGSGANCINSCNAWGWGAFSWSDWETAIWDYTGQLGASYGHTLSYEAALSYNESNPDGWYEEVGASMYAIYPEESL